MQCWGVPLHSCPTMPCAGVKICVEGLLEPMRVCCNLQKLLGPGMCQHKPSWACGDPKGQEGWAVELHALPRPHHPEPQKVQLGADIFFQTCTINHVMNKTLVQPVTTCYGANWILYFYYFGIPIVTCPICFCVGKSLMSHCSKILESSGCRIK